VAVGHRPTIDKRETKMTLQKKSAVIYEGGRGGTVVRAFGREGERAFLTGLHLVSVAKGAKDIPAAGGVAAAEVEAHDGQAKEAHE
jgi:hypothetical protein